MPDSELLTRVRARIAAIREAHGENAGSREKSRKAVEFLESDQAEHVKPNPGETKSHFEDKRRVALDVSNYVTNKVASTYLTPPTRRASMEYAEPDETGQADPAVDALSADSDAARAAFEAERDAVEDWYREHIWEFGEQPLTVVARDIDRWTFWTGTVAVEPRYRADFRGRGKDGVEPLYYRRHEFEVLRDEYDPRVAVAVVFEIAAIDSGKGSDRQVIYHYYDREVFALLRDWEIDDGWTESTSISPEDSRIQDGLFVHGLGRVPVVFVRETNPPRSFYGRGACTNLYPQALNINQAETDFAHQVRVHHGYMWSKGKIANFVMAPDVLIELPDNQDAAVGMVYPGGDLDKKQAALQRMIDNTCLLAGMAPGSLRMDPQQSKSGVAIIAERAETEAVRLARKPTFQRFEDDYNELAVEVYKVWGGSDEGVPEYGVITELKPPPTLIGDKELREEVEWMMANGMLSTEDGLAILEPDLPADERRRRLESVKVERDAMASRQREQARAANPIAALLQRPATAASPGTSPGGTGQ